MTRKSLLTGLLMISIAVRLIGQTSNGPEKGVLLLSGGGMVKSVIYRFVSLAGGPGAGFVYISTASSGFKLDSGFFYIPPDSEDPAANTSEFEAELCKLFWREPHDGCAYQEPGNGQFRKVCRAAEESDGRLAQPGQRRSPRQRFSRYAH